MFHQIFSITLLYCCWWWCLVAKSCSTLLQHHRLWPARLLCPWNFQTRILEWVATSFSRGSFHPGIEPVSPALADRFFFFFFLTAEPPGTPRPCGMSWLFPFYRWGLDQSSSLSKVSTLEISKVEFGMHIPDCLGVLSTPSQWFVPSVTLALEIQTRQPLSYLHP